MTKQELIDNGYEDGKKSFDFLWNKIEPYFNWKRVHDVMTFLNWEWKGDGVPSIETIISSARQRLFEVWEKEISGQSSGGFSAGYENGELWLSFTLEDCHTSDL